MFNIVLKKKKEEEETVVVVVVVLFIETKLFENIENTHKFFILLMLFCLEKKREVAPISFSFCVLYLLVRCDCRDYKWCRLHNNMQQFIYRYVYACVCEKKMFSYLY